MNLFSLSHIPLLTTVVSIYFDNALVLPHYLQDQNLTMAVKNRVQFTFYLLQPWVRFEVWGLRVFIIAIEFHYWLSCAPNHSWLVPKPTMSCHCQFVDWGPTRIDDDNDDDGDDDEDVDENGDDDDGDDEFEEGGSRQVVEVVNFEITVA